MPKMPRRANPTKPHGRTTAYGFFVQTYHAEMMKTVPLQDKAFSEFSRIVADRWKTLSDEEKKPFHVMSDRDKARFEEEMGNYDPSFTVEKKRRTPKDPLAPKRSLSSFLWFCHDERPKVNKQYPGLRMSESAKELGRLWRQADSEVKQKYEAMAQRDKERYVAETAAYKKMMAS